MRVLPPVDLDFTKKQLLLRMKVYDIYSPKYRWENKTTILRAIRLVENLNTRSIENDDHE
jgi:hypothetical protein